MKALSTNLCNNVLLRGRNDRIPITPMKLQKLLYFVCRDYVHATGEMPISELFEVWKYGPVLPSVYEEFRAFGSRPINEFTKDALGNSRKVKESSNPVLADALDIVWAKYKRYTGVELSSLTHQKGSGWYKAYMEDRGTITLEDMAGDNIGR